MNGARRRRNIIRRRALESVRAALDEEILRYENHLKVCAGSACLPACPDKLLKLERNKPRFVNATVYLNGGFVETIPYVEVKMRQDKMHSTIQSMMEKGFWVKLQNSGIVFVPPDGILRVTIFKSDNE